MFGEKRSSFSWKTPLPVVKHLGGGVIMLWCCVATSAAGNIAMVEGRMAGGGSVRPENVRIVSDLQGIVGKYPYNTNLTIFIPVFWHSWNKM